MRGCCDNCICIANVEEKTYPCKQCGEDFKMKVCSHCANSKISKTCQFCNSHNSIENNHSDHSGCEHPECNIHHKQLGKISCNKKCGWYIKNGCNKCHPKCEVCGSEINTLVYDH